MKAYEFNLDMFKNDYDYNSDHVIFEIAVADVADVILYKDQYYRICMINYHLGIIGVEKTEFNTTGKKYQFEQYITCPYCGYRDNDSWEISSDSGEMTCGACSSTFFYERNVTVDYTTVPIKSTEVRKI
ncbi:MAG TPA: hypothetical protein P5136_01650 [Methanofastidiosum sp.]|nr:hypothetical protein [Methanofastidiosum sp.]